MAGFGCTIKEMPFLGGAYYEMDAIFHPRHFHYLGRGK